MIEEFLKALKRVLLDWVVGYFLIPIASLGMLGYNIIYMVDVPVSAPEYIRMGYYHNCRFWLVWAGVFAVVGVAYIIARKHIAVLNK